MTRLRMFLGLMTLAAAGCGGDQISAPVPAVPVTATVTTAAGAPVGEVLCSFIPLTSVQRPVKYPTDAKGALIPATKDGKVILIPGGYAVLFESLPNKAANLKQVPAEFHEGGKGVIEVTVPSGGGELAIKLP